MEEQIEITHKLYQCRSRAKDLFRDEYQTKIRVYMNVILEQQKKFNLDTLPCVLEICSWESVKDNGPAIMLFMAAAVEILELGT